MGLSPLCAMLPASPLIAIAFGCLAVVVLVSAFWVVTLPNLFRAALSLGLVLLGVAGLFILLEAEFLAFVQILVYVGAVLTLVVFAIMLTAKLQTAERSPARRQPLPAAIASLLLFLVLATVTQSFAWPSVSSGEAISAEVLGQQLVTRLILPFEVISLVFVAAMVGAIAIAVQQGSTAPSDVHERLTP